MAQPTGSRPPPEAGAAPPPPAQPPFIPRSAPPQLPIPQPPPPHRERIEREVTQKKGGVLSFLVDTALTGYVKWFGNRVDSKNLDDAILRYKRTLDGMTGEREPRLSRLIEKSAGQLAKGFQFQDIADMLNQVDHMLEKNPGLKEKILTANLLKVICNLARASVGEAAGEMEPQELLKQIVAFLAQGMEKKVQDFKNGGAPLFIDVGDEGERLVDLDRTAERDFKEIPDFILKAALPNGVQDLELPKMTLPDWILRQIIDRFALGQLHSFIDELSKQVTSSHQTEMVKLIKDRVQDGEKVEGAIAELVHQISPKIQGLVTNLGEELNREESFEGNILMSLGASKELFKEGETLAYPLVIHVLGHLAQHSEKKLPVGELIAESVLPELVAYFKEPDVLWIEDYQRKLENLEQKLSKETEAVEEKYKRDLLQTQVPADLTFARDRRIKEIKSEFEERREALLSPFEPLVQTLLTKAGLDASGIKEILPPLLQDMGTRRIKNFLDQFCLEFYRDVVAQPPPADLERMKGLDEVEKKIHEFLDKQDLVKLVPDKFKWLVGGNLSSVERIVKPYLASTARNLFVHLAATYPLVKDQAEIDVVPAVLNHLALIVKETWTQFDPNEMKALTTHILAETGLNKLRIPKMFQGAVTGFLESTLQDLMLDVAKCWRAQQEEVFTNEEIADDKTKDGEVVRELLEKVPEQVAGVAKETLLKFGVTEPLDSICQEAGNTSYRLLMHILANLTKDSETRAGTVSSVLNPLLESLFIFAFQHRGEEHPNFEELVDEVLNRAGLNSEGLAKFVPIGSEALFKLLRSKAVEFCTDFYEEIVVKEGPKVDKEVPQFIVEQIDKNKEKLKESIREALVERLGHPEWVNSAFGELTESLSHLEHFAKGYIVNTLGDIVAHLAATSDQKEGEMVPRALQHLVKLAGEQLFPKIDSRFVDMAPSEKEQIRESLKPLAMQILAKFGLDDEKNIRAPKLLQKTIQNALVEALRDFIFKSRELRVAQEEEFWKNEEILDDHTSDSMLFEAAVKTVNDQLVNLPVPLIQPLLQKGSKLSYRLLIHVLARLTEHSERNETVATTVINRLLEALFAFVDEGKKDFNLLADDLLKKAGLDAAGLAQFVPVGAEPLFNQIRTQLVDFFTDCYQNVIAREEVPKEGKGYSEGRRFIEGMVHELMPTIAKALHEEENRQTIQESLVEVLQSNIAKLPGEQDWIQNSVGELTGESSPYLKRIEEFAEPYLVDTLSDLFANLAATTPIPEGDMAFDAIQHLIFIMSQEIKDPKALDKLRQWRDLPKGPEKDKMKATLCRELFGPCCQAIFDRAGWDQLENIRAPKVLQPILKKLMVETVLPDQLFRIAVDMFLPPPVHAQFEGLPEISRGMAEVLAPRILEQVKNYADLIAANTNKSLLGTTFDEKDEAWFGKEIETLLGEERPEIQSFFVQFLDQTLQYGLANLAQVDRAVTGDFANRLALYFRKRLKELQLDPEVIKAIRNYRAKMEDVRKLDKTISEKRKAAIKEYPDVSKKTIEELQRLKKERLALAETFEKSAEHHALLEAFQPLVGDILSDMGFPSEKELPVPYFLKKTIWDTLTTTVLPDLCFNNVEKLIAGFDALVPSLEKVGKVYADKLTERYAKKHPGATEAPIVTKIYALADYVVKVVESLTAKHGKDFAIEKLDEIVMPKCLELFAGNKEAQDAIFNGVQENRAEIAKWISEDSPGMIEMVKTRLGDSLRHLVAAPILKSVYSVIDNLEKVEQENSDALFTFISRVIPLLADHFDLATSTAKREKKKLLSDVDPLVMVREFEKAGKLHPAMPGYTEMKALKEAEGDPKKHAELKKKIEEKIRANFYQDFAQYLLNMAGIKSVADVPGEEEFWNIFGMERKDGLALFNQFAPPLLLNGVQKAFSPENMQNYFLNILTSLNSWLKEEQSAGNLPSESAKGVKLDTQMEKDCRRLIEMMKKVLPGTIVETLEMLPFIELLPGKMVAEKLKEALSNQPLSKVVEEGLTAALDEIPKEESKPAPAGATAPQPPLAEQIKRQGAQLVPNAFKKLESTLLANFVDAQHKLNVLIRWIFGSAAEKVKTFVDRLLFYTVISFVMKPIYFVMRWITVNLGIRFYVWWRFNNYVKQAESAWEANINANLLYQVADEFKLAYPVVERKNIH